MKFERARLLNPSGTSIALFTGSESGYDERKLVFDFNNCGLCICRAQLTSAQDRKKDRRNRQSRIEQHKRLTQVEGRWYTNGERRKRATIISSRLRGTEARNELGQFTRIEFDGSGSIRALDWDEGVRGDVRRRRIEWPTALPGARTLPVE